MKQREKGQQLSQIGWNNNSRVNEKKQWGAHISILMRDRTSGYQ